MFRIALVNTWKGSHPLLGMAYLPSYYRKYGSHNESVRFRIIEGDSEKRILGQLLRDRPDILGFHSYTPNYNKVLRIAHQIKRKSPSSIIVIGGPHITGLPSTLGCDFGVGFLGEGEESFREFVDSLLDNGGKLNQAWMKKIKGLCYHRPDGCVISTGCHQLIEPLDKIPFPARDLYNAEDINYLDDVLSIQVKLKGTVMFTSRGCPYNCIYCQTKTIFPRTRLFSAEYVVNEIEHLYKEYRLEAISIDDDLFMVSKSRLERIVQLLEERGLIGKIKYDASVRANLITEETVNLLKRMGVVQAEMGFETGSERLLKFMKKNSATQEDHQRALRLLSEAGIWVYNSFMLGSPTETEAEMEETLRLMSDKRIRLCTVNITTPLPGTEIWEIAKKRGLASEDMDWDRILNPQDRPESQIYLNENVPFDRFLKIFKRAQDIVMAKSAENWDNLKPQDMIRKFFKHPGNNLRFLWSRKEESFRFIIKNLANSLKAAHKPSQGIPPPWHNLVTPKAANHNSKSLALSVQKKHAGKYGIERYDLMNGEIHKLNAGCGSQKKDGYVNSDINPRHNPDIIWDLTKPSPFKDNCFDEIFCDNVLEHLQDCRPTIREFHRILKTRGLLHIIVPHYTSAFWDMPSHIRPFGYYYFYHYYKNYKLDEATEDVGVYFSRIKVRYIFAKKFQVWNHFIEFLMNKIPVVYEFTGLKYLFPCWQLDIKLWK